MGNIIQEMLNGLRLDKIKTFRNMAIVPLFFEAGKGMDYITLREGLESGTLSVNETSVHGSVPELTAVNTGHLPVLILDGEELAGAKQNRAVNTSILIPALSKVNIPVSCTEQGRWSYQTKTFKDSDLIMSHRTRSNRNMSVTMNLVNEGSFHSDQGQVWENIRTEASMANASSSTGAMSHTFEHLRPKLEDYITAFPAVEGQNGFVVLINGRPVGMEMISSPDKYSLLHAKLIRSYATEAVYREGDGSSAEAEQAAKFIKEASLCTFESYPSVGLGEDYRIIGNGMVGSALVADGTVVHCALFRRETAESRRSKMPDGMLDSRRRRESCLGRRMMSQDAEC
ncbi:ARPP-1 family domain-containing protein [Methanolobus psychrotolerans]|uniref:ARPP-1 family domain-containing protein n=1 Tax=Methanolobus psychrotolerans TaxID=1874706 RepID=UPI00101ADCBE|nr:DUF6569 family protein [Methanolobus psychrotolerans]